MTSPGERSLDDLLRHMSPTLEPGVFVFLTGEPPPGVRPRMVFEEPEGATVVVSAEATAPGSGSARFRQITLRVESSLEAVGFLARITTALAEAGIPCNPVSAYHHDHLFVPEDRAEAALARLEALSRELG